MWRRRIQCRAGYRKPWGQQGTNMQKLVQPLRQFSWLILAAASAACASDTPAPGAEAAAPGVYEFRTASRDGIGKFYMGREISHVMGHLGAGWLERPNREAE